MDTGSNASSRIVIAGGSGLLGRILAPWLSAGGWRVVILSRNPGGKAGGAHFREAGETADAPAAIRVAEWDVKTVGSADGWRRELESAAAVINLAGRSVDCRYTRKNRRLIYDSRIDSTRVLGQAIARCADPPKIWLNASTATIYRHSYTPMDEHTGIIGATPEAKDAFSIEVATAWERELEAAATPGTRKIALRCAMVLDANHPGVFRIMRKLVRLGLGGTVGAGTQYVSWIHERDFRRAVSFLLAAPGLCGPFNLAAPEPLPNAAFMNIFRRTCGRSRGVAIPRPLLEIGAFFLRTESELLLKSRCVVPARLEEAGFRFDFPALAGALADLCRRA